MAYLMAIDLGSSQMKLLVMDENANTVCSVSETYPTMARQDGWLEQRPLDWEMALKKGICRLKKQIELNGIKAISFSGHMSGVVLLDSDGKVLYPCIMLSDSRSQKQSETLNEKIGTLVKKRTGNPINNAFSLPKLVWIKEEEPDIYHKVSFWVSPKDYIRYCLTNEISTEYTDAYNSLCVNRDTLDWDEEIIEKSALDKNIFPKMRTPFDIAGFVTNKALKEYGLPEGIPVIAGAADMACAAFGMGLYENGDTALTLGTCATFLSVVPKPYSEYFGQVTFHPLVRKGNMFALGSHMNGGGAINWISCLLSEKGEIDYPMIAELSESAKKVPIGSNGLLTIPFLVGSGSPYFCSYDRQHMIGMKYNTTRAEMFRSQLEGVCCNLRQTFMAYQEMAHIEKLMLAGGGIKVSIWPEIIAEVFGVPIEIFDNPDVSTVGAGLIAGTAIGLFEAAEEIAKQKRRIIETKQPNIKRHKEYEIVYKTYLKYYPIMHKMDLEV